MVSCEDHSFSGVRNFGLACGASSDGRELGAARAVVAVAGGGYSKSRCQKMTVPDTKLI
jgi:hypothetical protein